MTGLWGGEYVSRCDATDVQDPVVEVLEAESDELACGGCRSRRRGGHQQVLLGQMSGSVVQVVGDALRGPRCSANGSRVRISWSAIGRCGEGDLVCASTGSGGGR